MRRIRKPPPVHRARILNIRQSIAAEGLQWDLEQAADGNVYGLLRMGERYRDGDGLRRNFKKSCDFFSKASAAGSRTAAEALAKIKPTEPLARGKKRFLVETTTHAWAARCSR